MKSDRPPTQGQGADQLLTLEGHANFVPGSDTSREILAQLETLAVELRHAPSFDPLEESGIVRAIELASSLVDEVPIRSREAVKLDELTELGQLGPYELLEMIGRGGMGAVYKARHRRLNKLVALKLVMPHRAENADSLSRFDREMQAVGMLDHPHLVRALDAGDADGKHYLAMEFIAGCDLARLLQERGPLPVAEACELITQAAKGLQAAHARGMIHRDIKPANLILAQQEFSVPIVKVLDLGLALLSQHHLPDQHGQTSASQIMGSVDYMAPEQAADSHAVDARADIYGLGATLFALLTGGSIFSHRSGLTLFQKLTALATESAPSVRDHRPEVSQRLADLVARMMARNPGERFDSMSAVIAALQPFTAGANLETLLVEPAAASSTQNRPNVEASSARAVPPRARPSRPRWLPIAIAAAFIGLVLGAIVISVRTPTGEIVVEMPDDLPRELADQIQVNVRGGGKVQVVDLKSGWTIDAHEGSYDIELKGSSDRIQLKDKRVTVVRNKQTLVQVTFQPVVSNSNATTAPIPAQVSSNTAKSEKQHPPAAPPLAIAPFDAATARAHQEAWAKHLKVPVEFENSVGMKFRLMPPGEYIMGTSQDEIDAVLALAKIEIEKDYRFGEYIRTEGPPCRVILPRPLYVGVHEVTQKQFYLVTGKSPSVEVTHNPEFGPRLRGIDTAEFPVESVTWYDMFGFCEQLSQLDQLEPFAHRSGETSIEVKRGAGYRLPSEAEWEYACRAGTTTLYYTGNTAQDANRAAWFIENWEARLHPVGLREPNAFGLYDMLGNVGEATLDSEVQRPALHTGSTPGVYTVPDLPPVSETGYFMTRGGDVLYSREMVRSAFRWVSGDKSRRGDRSGFRVVLPVDSARKALDAKDAAPADINVSYRRAAQWLHGLKVPFHVNSGNSLKLVDINAPLPSGAFQINHIYLGSDAVDALGDDLVAAFEKNFRGTTLPNIDLNTTALSTDSLRQILRLPALKEAQSVTISRPDVTDAMLSEIVKLPNLTGLNIGKSSKLTDEGLRHLLSRPEITGLTLAFPTFSPQGISHLRQLPHLEYLNLDGLPTTTTHVDELIQLKLQVLVLCNSGVDDAQAKQLARMSGLMNLNLGNSLLTDEGLATLSQLKTLQTVQVTGTKVTAEGLRKFRQALPDCTVYSD